MAIERRQRDREALRRLFDGDFWITQQGFGDGEVLGRKRGRPTPYPAPRSGRIEPGAGALAEHAALELGERAEDMVSTAAEKPATGRRNSLPLGDPELMLGRGARLPAASGGRDRERRRCEALMGWRAAARPPADATDFE